MNEATRRNLIKSSLLLAPAALKAQSAAKAIKVGLVGCGGRGTGAAAQALKADDYAELTAMADMFQERVDISLEQLRKESPNKVKVDPSKIFLGLDAFQKLIASDVDVVLLATPPGFRPMQLRACIEAGKHVFCEKPVAVDSPGIRSVLDTAKLAKEKNLSLVAGFCWRYNNMIMETFDKLHSGAIGNLVSYYGTYYTSPVKPMPPAADRPSGMSDVEWQIRNWYNFVWTCGDGLVEQGCHTVDKVMWAMKDEAPLSCTGLGGRQIPANGGNIYDHIEVNYVWKNGFRAFVGHRQIPGCHNENADYIMGSNGTCILGKGPVARIEGPNPWKFSGQKNEMYQAEHDALFAAIRRGQPINDGVRMTTSTMTAIMGRMAAYTGREVTWEQAMNSNERFFPENLTMDMKLEVPDWARPGVYKLV
jgi:myo-inositol 2-dehydrogenase / D-chiro-inositol 1-dehydrogenase